MSTNDEEKGIQEKEEKKTFEPSKGKKIVVKAIELMGEDVLIEFFEDDYPYRKVVKRKDLNQHDLKRKLYEISKSNLKSGKNHGDKWEDLFELDSPLNEKFAKQLRIRGIWTYEEFVGAGVGKIASILMSVLIKPASKMVIQIKEMMEV